jgi:CubicO group peptidase (beta-lactamase class C family)
LVQVKDEYAGVNLTIRDLLCHRSGLPRHDLLWYKSNLPREECIKRLSQLNPSKGFREVWQYQNLMYVTAGYLAGEVAGSDWEVLTKINILEPLGMNDTVCKAKEFLQKSNKATPYTKDRQEKIQRRDYAEFENAGPAGMMASSIVDVAKWLQLQLNQGKYQKSAKSQQLVSSKNLAEMHRPHTIIPLDAHAEKLYGTFLHVSCLGWEMQPYQGKKMIHHGGNIDGISTLASFFPNEGFGMIVLANLGATPFRRAITHRLYDLLFDAQDNNWNTVFKKVNDKLKHDADKAKVKDRKARKKNTKPSHALKDFAGIYQHPGYADMTLRLRQGRLEAFLAGKFWPLEHYHYDVFDMLFEDDNREKVSFQTGEEGEVTSLKFKIESALEPATFMKKVKKSR